MSGPFEEVGVSLVQQVLGIGRTLQMYDPNNHAVTAAVQNLAMTINGVVAQSPAGLKMEFVDNIFVLNDQRINPTRMTSEAFAMLKSVFDDREMGGLLFRRAVDPEALRGFFAIFVQPVPDAGARARLRGMLDQYAQAGIELLASKSLEGEEESRTKRVSRMGFALQTYARTIVSFRETVAKLERGENPIDSPLAYLRVLQDLVEVCLERPTNLVRSLWLLSVNRDTAGQDAAHLHAGNIAVISVLMGRVMGLGRLSLFDLATSAFLSGVPEALCPQIVSKDPRSRTEEQLDELLLQSAPIITQSLPLNADTVKRIIVAREHSLPFISADGSPTSFHPYSRMVGVAHAFGQRLIDPAAPMPPPQAFAWVQQGSGRAFDPLAVDALEAVVHGYMSS